MSSYQRTNPATVPAQTCADDDVSEPGAPARLQKRRLRMAASILLALSTITAISIPPKSSAAGTDPQSDPPAGVMPRHIPPLLVGRLDSVSPETYTFRLLVMGAGNGIAGPVNVLIRNYTDLSRLSVINNNALQRGDSIMVQGSPGNGDTNFQAQRIIRLAKKVPFAPGVMLADQGSGAAMPAMTDMSAAPTGTEPAPVTPTAPVTPGLPTVAPVVAPNVPGAPRGETGKAAQKAKIEEQAQRVVRQSARRGVLTGQIVSLSPSVMEAYDGSLWNVTLSEGGLILEQVRVPLQSLKPGDSLLVKGSETGAGTFRASEIDVLPPGVQVFQPKRRGARKGALRP